MLWSPEKYFWHTHPYATAFNVLNKMRSGNVSGIFALLCEDKHFLKTSLNKPFWYSMLHCNSKCNNSCRNTAETFSKIQCNFVVTHDFGNLSVISRKTLEKKFNHKSQKIIILRAFEKRSEF